MHLRRYSCQIEGNARLRPVIGMLGSLFGWYVFCVFFFQHRNVCIGFILISSRVGKTFDAQLISRGSNTFFLNAHLSKSFKGLNESYDRVDQIIKTILGSFRDTPIVDILRSVSETEGLLTGIELLELMCKFVDRRDYIRLGDMLIPYLEVSKKELLMASGHDCRKLKLVNGRQSRFGNMFTTVKQRIEDVNKKGLTTDECLGILDLNVLMLLTYSIQQMKPNRRKMQSIALLQSSIDARIDRSTIAVQMLSIMTSLNYLSMDETACSVTLLRSVAQFMQENMLSYQGIQSEKSSGDMTILGNKAASCEERGCASVTGTRDFIPSEVYLSATAHTPSWSKVNDVMIEFKQHRDWKENYRRLDVVTCLNIIHGTVLDKFLNLLTLKKLRVLNNDEQIDANSSIYTESLKLVRHLLSCHTGQKEEDVMLSERIEGDRDNRIGGNGEDRKCVLVYRPTPSLNDVLDFMGCGEERIEDSLFVSDPRLSRAIALTQLSLRSAGAVTVTEELGHVSAEIEKDEDEEKKEKEEDEKNKEKKKEDEEEEKDDSLYAPYCSYLQSILASNIPPPAGEAASSTSEGEDNTLNIRDLKGSTGDNRAIGVRAVRVLVLGDGDFSFSASLLKMAIDVTHTISDLYGSDDCDGTDKVTKERGNGTHEASQSPLLESRPRIPSSSCQSSPEGKANECWKEKKKSLLPLEVTATTFESPNSLVAKYEGAKKNIKFIETVSCGCMSGGVDLHEIRDSEGDEIEQVISADVSASAVQDKSGGKVEGEGNRVMYNVDATRLSSEDFSGQPFDALIFNFPFGDAVSALDSTGAGTGVGVGAGVGAGAGDDPPVRGGRGKDLGPSDSSVSDTQQGNSVHVSSIEAKDEKEREKGERESERAEDMGVRRIEGVVGPTSAFPTNDGILKSNRVHKVSKQSDPKSRSSPRSGGFDTHWVARGRHMHLIEGVFRSARNVLHRPEYRDGSRNKNGGDGSGRGVDSSGSDGNRGRDRGKETRVDSGNSDSGTDSNDDSNTDSDSDIGMSQSDQAGNIGTYYSHPSSESVGESNRSHNLFRNPHTRPDGGPRVMITLLLSQAQEWEVERIAKEQGFSLSEIIPFEDLIFDGRGYSRKRTYSDDIFPSSSSSSSSSTSTSTSSSSSSSTSSSPCAEGYLNHNSDRESKEDGTLDPIPCSVFSDTGSHQQNVRAARESYVLQRKKWRQSTIVAWTFVFTHSR